MSNFRDFVDPQGMTHSEYTRKVHELEEAFKRMKVSISDIGETFGHTRGYEGVQMARRSKQHDVPFKMPIEAIGSGEPDFTFATFDYYKKWVLDGSPHPVADWDAKNKAPDAPGEIDYTLRLEGWFQGVKITVDGINIMNGDSPIAEVIKGTLNLAEDEELMSISVKTADGRIVVRPWNR